jgi:cytochrome c6
MRRRIVVTLAVVAVSAISLAGCKKQQQGSEAPATGTATTAPATTAPAAPGAAPGGAATTAASGEELYKKHCAACHPDGGNPMNPKKTLHSGDMARNNVKTADDVVKLMRNPGTGMTKFDDTTLPDADAKAIADYTLATFK